MCASIDAVCANGSRNVIAEKASVSERVVPAP
jgi:hypothetical protein